MKHAPRRAGSAAIYGLRGKAHVNCFIMFPEGRVSEIQERQMTTVPDENIHCVSIEGSFDDCQDIVKAAFADKPFRYYKTSPPPLLVIPPSPPIGIFSRKA